MRWSVIKKFLLLFVFMTVINTVAWQKYVAANFYDCVDEAIPGYWEPGFWVHSHDGQLVTAVPQIVHNQSMANPDTIKQGWTVSRLLGLWFAFFAASIIVSLVFARIPWKPRSRSN
jgi:uncharacterized iron-regulated membrane protein